MSRRFVSIAVVAFVLSGCAGSKPSPAPPQDPKFRDSYSLGYEFGDSVRRGGVDVDPDVVVSALRDGLRGADPGLSPEEMRESLVLLRKQVRMNQDRLFQERVARNLEKGSAFLASNRTREGVTVLPDGLQYEVLREGDGPTPGADDMVSIQYRGTLVDGTEFDSSYARGAPAKVLVAGVMKGWTEALSRMKVGSNWRIFVPPDLGYGKRAYGRVPPGSTLIFDLELLSIDGKLGRLPDGSLPDASPAVRTGEPPAASPAE